MAIIGVVGLTPGAGAKTVSANLAHELGSEALPTLCADLCPYNMLRTHFGMPLADGRGLVQSADHIFVYAPGVYFLPFGRAAAETSEMLVSGERPVLVEKIRELEPRFEHIIVHLGLAPRGSWTNLAAEVDLLICVVEPAPLSYPFLFDAVASDAGASEKLRFVFNKTSFSSRLRKDTLQLLKAELNTDLLVPMELSLDENVPEALATQQPVSDYSINACATKEFQALTLWLKTQV